MESPRWLHFPSQWRIPTSPRRRHRGGENGFSEGQLPKQFGSDDYQVLVIAETYQTGFDKPLLHIMYVDEKVKTKGVRVSRPCLVSTGSRPARPTPSCSTL